MPPSCRPFQDAYLERAGSPGAPESASAAHRASCAECDAFAQRVDAQARALRGLERVRAPHELAGLVVATFHEGQRQDRAVVALAALGRKLAPDELDRAVLHAHGVFDASELEGERTGAETESADASASEHTRADDAGRLHAPHVLDRLVDEELREPSKALVRRFAGRLPRLSAPSELDERVARMLATGARAPRSTRGPLLRAAALLVVFGAGAGVLFWVGGRESNAAELIAVRIERVSSAAELGPEARALLGGLTGGLSEFGTTLQAGAAFDSGSPDAPRGEPR